MVLSASMSEGVEMRNDPFFFAYRQMIFIALGLFAFGVLLIVPSDFLNQMDVYLLVVGFILLLALFFPGIGYEAKGSLRWIDLGPIKIQPSEVAKLCLLVYIAGYSVRRLEEMSSTIGFLRPLVILSSFSLLIMVQPDYGTTAVICLMVMAMLFFAGISFSHFMLLIGLFIILGVIAVYAEPYRMLRLLSFMDPFDDVLGSDWQLYQSLVSFGQGGWFGLGLGNSIQKNFFLPEAHTDFIFAILAEELGLVGALLLLLTYIVLLVGIFRVSLESFKKIRPFQGYLTFGIGFLIGLQVILNLAVNLGLLPTKGLTLPFISYGGTSILIMISLVGLVVRINNENKLFN